MGKKLPLSFFEQSSESLARNLLGKRIVRVLPDGSKLGFVISETEAYLGPEDKASHARFGKTKRNAPMFSRGGTIYVYFVYGMHHMLNIVSGKEGDAQAVLLRSTFEISGPARLAKALQVDTSFSGKFLGEQSAIWIEDPDEKFEKFSVLKVPRIGIDYAEEWKDEPLRFILQKSQRAVKKA